LADFGLFTRDARFAHGAFLNPADDKTVRESQFCAIAFRDQPQPSQLSAKLFWAAKDRDDSCSGVTTKSGEVPVHEWLDKI
jgi:hypothetical protein